MEKPGIEPGTFSKLMLKGANETWRLWRVFFLRFLFISSGEGVGSRRCREEDWDRLISLGANKLDNNNNYQNKEQNYKICFRLLSLSNFLYFSRSVLPSFILVAGSKLPSANWCLDQNRNKIVRLKSWRKENFLATDD